MSSAENERTSKGKTLRRIAIIGAGPVGTNLAVRLIKSGHMVSISNSRGPGSLQREEQSTGATALDIGEATALADAVILAVPFLAIHALSTVLKASLRPGTLLIDSGNYYPARDGHVEEIDKGMPDSVWVSQTLSFPVIKVFNNIIAANISDSAKAKGATGRVALPIAADDEEAAALVATLVDSVGFDAYLPGQLIESWRQEPGQPAYCTEPTLEQLPTLLSRADRTQGPVNREKARAMIEKLPSDFSPLVLLRVARFSAGIDTWSPRSWAAALQFMAALARPRWTRSA